MTFRARRGAWLLWLSCAAFFLSGCAGHSIKPETESLAPRFIIRGVPFYPQEAYQCGPAAMAMALGWAGLQLRPKDLVDEVYTPARKGSLQPDMMAAARRHGRIAYEISGMKALLAEVAAGHPVIVLQNLGLSWYPVWHYALVIGYDAGRETVFLHSGTTANRSMSARVFYNTWKRSNFWGLLVLRPTQLPATANETRFVAAVYGLEKARQWLAAVTGYQTALSRWPQSLPAAMGLGNSFYALGDLASAETAFRDAARRHPDSGAAFNNLAQVLFEQGALDAALDAARTAVALGGPLKPTFQETLDAIQRARSTIPTRP
jgi:tetratricopeptide (TPR) repeat protein